MINTILDVENQVEVHTLECGDFFEYKEKVYRMTDYFDEKGDKLAMDMNTGELKPLCADVLVYDLYIDGDCEVEWRRLV
ncbi:MAG: hypothetical protein WDA42_00830 [Candidatus Bathyarchaeia archaeon]